jgi:hypothetical protein
VREPQSYFDDIPKESTPKEMLDLASHIIETMIGHFQPKKFEDRYEDALRDLIKRKQAGEEITPALSSRNKVLRFQGGDNDAQSPRRSSCMRGIRPRNWSGRVRGSRQEPGLLFFKRRSGSPAAPLQRPADRAARR